MVDAGHPPLPGADPADRVTKVKFDLAGHAIETTDANDHVTHASWDLFGRMVKQWQTVTDVDGQHQTLFTQYRYDALGRLTHILTPDNDPSRRLPIARQQIYNAFGEVTGRSLNGVQYEYSEFDNAGNVWRTNAGDGVDKVYIYTGTGKLSMEIRGNGADAGSVYNMRHYSSAQALFSFASPLYGTYDPHFVINETRYDLMGRIIEQIGSQQQTETGTSATVIHRGAVMGTVIQTSEWEEDTRNHHPGWTGSNQLELNYALPPELESSEYRITVDYRQRPGGWTNDSGAPSGQPSTPATYSTILDAATLPGSAGKVTLKITGAAIDESEAQHYRIEMKDINGQWKLIADSTDIKPAPLLKIGAPPQALAGVTLKYRLNGVETDLPVFALTGDGVLFSTVYTVDGVRHEVAEGTYTYRVLYHDAILNADIEYASGTFAVKETSSGKTASIQSAHNRATLWTRPISNQRLDRWGNVISVTNPHEANWNLEANEPGIANVTTRFSYNANNQLMEQHQDIADLSGNVTTLRGNSNYYDALGRQTASRDAMNHLGTTVYNNSGQLGDEYHADGGQTHHDYNVFGEQTTLRHKVNATTWLDQFYTWDKLGHVTSVSTGEVDVYKTGFYGEPEITIERDGSGPRRLTDTYTYDEMGRRTMTANAAGESIRARYDADGNVIDTEDAMHQHTVSHYDAFHHKIDETNANHDSMSWVVDAFGKITSHRDLSGTTITYSYDGLNQLILQQSGARAATGNQEQHLVYTYNGLQLARFEDVTTGTITTYTYDLAGRHTRERTTVRDLVPVTPVPPANSTEAFLVEARLHVVQFYVAVLDRTPEPGGMMYWMNQLQNANYGPQPEGQTRQQVNALARIQVASEIVNSDEAHALFPVGMSDTDFVRKLYQTALKRLPTQEELDTTLTWLAEPHSRGEAIVRLIDGLSSAQDHAAFDPRVNAALPGSAPGQTRDTVVQNNFIEYDALGRTTHVADGRFDVRLAYDNNDNRTRVETRQAESYIDAHNTFDAMNRAVIIGGDEITVKGQKSVVAGIKGHLIQYDYAGRRTRDSYTYKHAGVVDAATTEEFTYDAASRLINVRRGSMDIDVRFYDAAGRVVQSGQLIYSQDSIPDEAQLADYGVLAENRTYGYDRNGHVMRTKFRQLDGKAKDDLYYTDDANNNVPGYDAEGNVTHYSVVPHNLLAGHSTFSLDYVAFDSYKEKSVRGNVDQTAKNSLSEYDVNGNLVKVSGAGDGITQSLFASDANGRVLRKTYTDLVGKAYSSDYNLIVNGEVFGGINSRSNILDGFANPYESAGSSANTSAPTIYRVQNAGETLQSVAHAVWGDSRLWFLIADANGLNDASGLNVNQILKIPPRANTVHDDATTFKPYDASAIRGDTTPSLPPAIPGEPCGAAGKVIVAVVAIIVTIVVTWIAGPAAGGESGGAFIGAFSAEQAAVLGAVAGNLAGQAVGNMIGVQQGFDFKGFTLSFLAAGVSSALPAGSTFGAGATGIAARAAISNALGQGIAIAMDMQRGFDWRGVAASAAGAAVGEYVGDKLGVNGTAPSTFDMADFGKRLLKSFAAGGTTAIAKGGKVSVVQVASDAFGNSIGESVAGALKPVDNRALLNAANQKADPAYYGSGGVVSPSLASNQIGNAGLEGYFESQFAKSTLDFGNNPLSINGPDILSDTDFSSYDNGHGSGSPAIPDENSAPGTGNQGAALPPGVLNGLLGVKGNRIVKGDGPSLDIYGQIRDTRYHVPDAFLPENIRPASGNASYAFDSMGQTFIRLDGTLFAPPVPYYTPTLAELRRAEYVAGIWDTAKSLPVAAWEGMKTNAVIYGAVLGVRAAQEIVRENVMEGFNTAKELGFGGVSSKTFSAGFNFVHGISPLGVLDSVAHDDYYGAGAGTFNVAMMLGAPVASELGVSGFRFAKAQAQGINSAVDAATGVNVNPFVPELSVGSPVRLQSANGRTVLDRNVAAGQANFTGGDQYSANIALRPDIDANGTFDVVAHGSAKKIEVTTPDGTVMVDHRIAARLIQGSPGYAGQPIRLLSCDTGMLDNGFAQNLANKMGVSVSAPDNLIWAYGDGSTVVAPRMSLNPTSPSYNYPNLANQGSFRTFTPQGIK